MCGIILGLFGDSNGFGSFISGRGWSLPDNTKYKGVVSDSFCQVCWADFIGTLIILLIIYAILKKKFPTLIGGLEDLIKTIIKTLFNLLKLLMKGLFSATQFLFEMLGSLLEALLNLLKWLLGQPRKRKNRKRKSGSRFANWYERFKMLNWFHKGIVLKGSGILPKRMATKTMLKHTVIVGKSGAGKSAYLLRHMHLSPSPETSIFSLDPDGSHFEACLGALQHKYGFEDIRVLNFIDLNKTHLDNPLLRLTNLSEITQFAKMIVKQVYQDQKGDAVFWVESAVGLLVFVISFLKGMAEQKPEYKKYYTLLNLKLVAENFSRFGEYFEDYIQTADERVASLYHGFIGNEPKIQSNILATLVSSFGVMTDDKAAKLSSCSENVIDLDSIRKRKTAIFLIVPEKRVKFYAFLIGIFINQLFDKLLDERAEDETLKVQCIIDEMGNCGKAVGGDTLDMVATSVRRRDAALVLTYQSLSQMEDSVGSATKMETLLAGSLATQIYLAGTTGKQAENISSQMGEVDFETELENGQSSMQKKRLVTAEELRTMKKFRALIVSDTTPPFILKLKAWYKSPILKIRSKIKPTPLEYAEEPKLSYITELLKDESNNTGNEMEDIILNTNPEDILFEMEDDEVPLPETEPEDKENKPTKDFVDGLDFTL